MQYVHSIRIYQFYAYAFFSNESYTWWFATRLPIATAVPFRALYRKVLSGTAWYMKLTSPMSLYSRNLSSGRVTLLILPPFFLPLQNRNPEVGMVVIFPWMNSFTWSSIATKCYCCHWFYYYWMAEGRKYISIAFLSFSLRHTALRNIFHYCAFLISISRQVSIWLHIFYRALTFSLFQTVSYL